MDETAFCYYMLSDTTVDKTGTKTVRMSTTGHEKAKYRVVFAAKVDGMKLPHFIVFKGNKRKVATLSKQIKGAVITTSVNGWMNEGLTLEWLDLICGVLSFSCRLLVWGSYTQCRGHISKRVLDQLQKRYKMDAAVVPGGSTRYTCTSKHQMFAGMLQVRLECVFCMMNGWLMVLRNTPGWKSENTSN